MENSSFFEDEASEASRELSRKTHLRYLATLFLNLLWTSLTTGALLGLLLPREVIWQGIREGHFATVDERFAARFVLSALNWTHQWYRPDGAMTAEEIGATLADLLLGGLGRTI